MATIGSYIAYEEIDLSWEKTYYYYTIRVQCDRCREWFTPGEEIPIYSTHPEEPWKCPKTKCSGYGKEEFYQGTKRGER